MGQNQRMAFEDQWPVIEAFIEDRAVAPSSVLVDTIREMVRIGEVPALADQNGAAPTVAGPGLGFPGHQPTIADNPSTDLPLLAGPGLGFPSDDPSVMVFQTWADAQQAHTSMSELAEQQLIE